jgi:YesN/AraC family two-component response regulator
MNTTEKFDISILYVDDEAATRDEIVNHLRYRAKEVMVACDGKQGLEEYLRKKPDLVITDIRMPVMDGLKMAQEIKERDRSAKIIMTTAHIDTEYLLKAIDTGVDGYVMKPIDTKKLGEAIKRCTDVIEYQRSARRYEEERDRTMKELQATIARLNTLHGILPICSSCKKIRDDKGAWSQLELYIMDHTDATFSHGLCNECAARLYPQYFGKDKNQEGSK